MSNFLTTYVKLFMNLIKTLKKLLLHLLKYFLSELFYLKLKRYLLNLMGITHNSLVEQNQWSKDYLMSDDKDGFSNRWGIINQNDKLLGDYRIVLEKITVLSNSLNCVLEIGSLDGKWSEVLIKNFKSVSLIDLNEELLPILKKKFGKKFDFYTTSGNELNQIENESIDLIFSMDSLVRLPSKLFILDYFWEFKRVLKHKGEVYVHLPCNSKKYCIENGFTDVSKSCIIRYANVVRLNIVFFDENTLNHGIMLHLKKG
tara:strand:+ start:4476 stop:5249 length:774 start_codon:yes stop_codon:yes gene_type:complete